MERLLQVKSRESSGLSLLLGSWPLPGTIVPLSFPWGGNLASAYLFPPSRWGGLEMDGKSRLSGAQPWKWRRFTRFGAGALRSRDWGSGGVMVSLHSVEFTAPFIQYHLQTKQHAFWQIGLPLSWNHSVVSSPRPLARRTMELMEVISPFWHFNDSQEPSQDALLHPRVSTLSRSPSAGTCSSTHPSPLSTTPQAGGDPADLFHGLALPSQVYFLLCCCYTPWNYSW